MSINFLNLRASLEEKTLTPAEKKKREEVAKAIEREHPNMPMGMKMAIATKTAKRVAEEEELDEATAEKAMKQHHKWLKSMEGETSESIGKKLEAAKVNHDTHAKEVQDKLKSGAMKQGGYEHKEMVKKWNRLQRNVSDLQSKHDWLKGKENKAKKVAEENISELNQMTLARYQSKAKSVGMQGGAKSAKHLAGAKRAGEKLKYGNYNEENNIVAVIDGKRSDRKYNDADHAHNSLSKLVGYQKAKKAELYVNGQKTKHYELNKRYDDFEPKKLSEEQIDEAAPFKTKEDAVNYAKKKVKTFRDKDSGIEVYSMPGGSHHVVHTDNTQGSMHLKKQGGKKVASIMGYAFEEVKQVDELKQSTVKSYTDKATSDYGHAEFSARAARKPEEKSFWAQRAAKRAKGISKAVSKTNEEVEQLDEMSAPDRFKDYHNETAKLMKGIHSALSQHYTLHNKDAHWGHVGDIRHIHDQLRDIHDRLHEQGEYAKAAKEHTAKMNMAMKESVEEQHYCAKHVYSELFGEGQVVEADHAEPDENGNISWYNVQFEHGIEKVFTEDIEIMVAEYHANHKRKKRESK